MAKSSREAVTEEERTLLNAANEGHIHTLTFLLQKGVSADVYEVCEMRYLAHFYPLSFILLFSAVYVSVFGYADVCSAGRSVYVENV